THEVDQLREGQRDHGEVDAAAADGDRPDDEAEQCRDEHAPHDGDPRAEAAGGGEPGGDVGGRAEERRVPEGQNAAEAEQQVEGAGKERKTQELHHEYGIDAEQGRAQEEHGRDGVDDGHRARHGYSLPNRPAGRTMSTSAMMTNTTM